MEQVIIALLGVSITLILYLDRCRRADIAQLRQVTQDGFAQFTSAVMDLHGRVGRLEGRTDTTADPSP